MAARMSNHEHGGMHEHAGLRGTHASMVARRTEWASACSTRALGGVRFGRRLSTAAHVIAAARMDMRACTPHVRKDCRLW